MCDWSLIGAMRAGIADVSAICERVWTELRGPWSLCVCMSALLACVLAVCLRRSGAVARGGEGVRRGPSIEDSLFCLGGETDT